jgi:hypothetical protein
VLILLVQVLVLPPVLLLRRLKSLGTKTKTFGEGLEIRAKTLTEDLETKSMTLPKGLEIETKILQRGLKSNNERQKLPSVVIFYLKRHQKLVITS